MFYYRQPRQKEVHENQSTDYYPTRPNYIMQITINYDYYPTRPNYIMQITINYKHMNGNLHIVYFLAKGQKIN